MKKILLGLLCGFVLPAVAQITINSNHLPNAGDLLYTRAATLLTDVDLNATGPNYNWTFGDDVIQAGALDAGTECADLSSLSLLDQLFFNSPLFPDYNSDFGIGAALLDNPLISIENAYQIYKNSGGVYAMTGIVATVQGVPLNAQYNERDIIYDLPLTYPASGNTHSVLELDVPTVAYYGTDQYRNYECDGWGTINIYGESFDVLRVKSTLVGFDSIYVSLVPFGFQFPKDITTYQWISTEFKVPVLEIVSTAGGFGGAQITARTADFGVGMNEQPTAALNVFPNPTNGQFQIANASANDKYSIFNSAGQCVLDGTLTSNRMDVDALPAGIYFMRLQHENTLLQSSFIKQ